MGNCTDNTLIISSPLLILLYHTYLLSLNEEQKRNPFSSKYGTEKVTFPCRPISPVVLLFAGRHGSSLRLRCLCFLLWLAFQSDSVPISVCLCFVCRTFERMKNVYLTRWKSLCAPKPGRQSFPESIVPEHLSGIRLIGVGEAETGLVTGHNEDESRSQLQEARQ